MATAASIMTREVLTVSPNTPLNEVADLLSGQRYGALPVVDTDRHVLGIVTEEDLARRAARLHLPRHIAFLDSIIYLENPRNFEEEATKILATTAREIMHDTFATVAPDTAVEDVAERLLEEDLRRLLVLDETERLIGIITRADIVRMMTGKERNL